MLPLCCPSFLFPDTHAMNRRCAENCFHQLIEITEGAREGVDSLEIGFNNELCEVSLINFRDAQNPESEDVLEDENKFKRILYNTMYTHYDLQQPVQFNFVINCASSEEYRVYPGGDDDARCPWCPGIEPGEDIGSYELRKHVMPQIHKLFTDNDHDDWMYGRRIFRMNNRGNKVICVIEWNHPSPNAGAAAAALLRTGLPLDLIQNACDSEQGNYAKKLKRSYTWVGW